MKPGKRFVSKGRYFGFILSKEYSEKTDNSFCNPSDNA